MLSFILKNLDHFKLRFWLIFSIALVDAGISFMIPIVLSSKFSGNITQQSSNKAFLLVAAIFLSSIILQWFIRRYGESLRYHYSNYIKLKFFRALELLSLDSNKNQVHTGYLLSLINRVADSVFDAIFLFCWSIPGAIATTVLFFYVISSQSVLIASINAVVIIIFMLISFFLSKKMSAKFKILNDYQARLNEQLVDFMNNSRTLKLLNAFDFAEKKLNKKIYDTDIRAQDMQNLHSNRWALLHFIYGLAFLGTLYVLVTKISSGQLSVATMIIFIPTFNSVKGNLERTSETVKSFIESSAYLRTLQQSLPIDFGNRSVKLNKKVPKWSQLSIDNLHYKYENTGKTVSFKDFNISKGDRVMISGKSGRGKTTLINIISGHLEPGGGSIQLDGANLKVGNLFFNQISMVTQDSELFNLSLKDNLCLGEDISDSRINKLLADADLENIITLDETHNLLGEKGNKFSVGQKQRVNIIRALLSTKSIVIFDEPTSNLDSKTEQKIIDLMDRELEGKTAIIISHRPELARICNKTYQI